jgi:hypothetical protein
MSTLPGGPADKAGLKHEALWGVVGMVSVLAGEAEAIRIEEPGTDGAEFYLEHLGRAEHWQAKRQVIGQKTWSLQLLKTEGVLGFFRQRVDAGESCVFASITDAPELRSLAENAAEATTWSEFEQKFLVSERWKDQFNALQKHLGYTSGEKVFAFLRNVRIEGARESTLEALLTPILRAWVTGAPQTALALLRDFYLASVHKKLSAGDIWSYLESHGVRRRIPPDTKTLKDLVKAITGAYVARQRAKLIRGEPIPRKLAEDTVKLIKEAQYSLDILITGPAGGGKSGVILQTVEKLAAAGIPVLAFRLDRIEPVTSTQALGEKLQLPESPAIVLSQCPSTGPAVLVIDQLDFVSSSSGRHPDFFEVVAAIADEVRGLRRSRHIHLIMACRQFDFDNDSRIRRLLPAHTSPTSVGPLTDHEVKAVVEAEGGHLSQLSPKQMELLRLPQNLSLFIDARLVQTGSFTFVTQKELLDAYWDHERRAVSDRHPEHAPQWMAAIAKLTQEMSSREELSVPKALMDEFPPEFLATMVSEGVFTFDGRRYGFGHESFFDYCFARNVAAKDGEFVEFLENDQQQLFRRAQLRQVLVYLRDDDFKRYIRNVELALGSGKIRPHLKLLVLELIGSFVDPREEELVALMPYLKAELDCQRRQETNPNKMASRAWDSFFVSRTLFLLADRLGYIEQWLRSGEEWLEDRMTLYLRWQADSHGDRVAELLEPFAEAGGKWRDRLRHIMEWVRLGKSRRLFDLFLRLLDNGTLDKARGPIAVNSTFWSMLHGLAEQRPSWCAEVASHWLDRQVAIAISSAAHGEDPKLELHDQFGVNDLFESAKRAPREFLEHVLPSILRACDTFAHTDDEGLMRDRIWPIRFGGGGYIGLEEAYLGACESAFEALGKESPQALRPFIALLRESRLFTANQLLLTAYLSAPELFAEEAMCLLADEAARFRCGFSDSPFWLSRMLIEKCSVNCSEEAFKRVEAAALALTTPYERSPEGFRHRGYHAYTLVSALDPHRRSTEANARLAEWQRKFGQPAGAPEGIRTFTVESPISKEKAEHMSDEQWLQAIAKHSAERHWYDRKRPESGGASELAWLFQEFVKKDAVRFGRLALRFPKGTNTSYYMNVLYGLKDAAVDPQLKLDVAQQVFNLDDVACLMAALDVLATIEAISLSDDALAFIRRMATEHPDPKPEKGNEKDPLFIGINSVRGHAVDAIRDLILHDKTYMKIFAREVEHCVNDPTLAVRACTASTLIGVSVHDMARAVDLFKRLVDADDKLLLTRYVDQFIARALRHHADDLRPLLERMLRAKIDKVREAGGRLACLARLHHSRFEDLSEAAITGDVATRLGAAEVARHNITHPDCRPWCEATLRRLFNDEDENVRRQAANCFWYLWQQPDVPLTDYEDLIGSFLDSRAFADDPSYLLHTLDDTRQRVPNIILDVCDRFITKCTEKARDIRTSMAADETTIGKLVFRAYAQLEALPLRTRALDLIDRMCSEGLQSAGKQLAEFER